MLDYRLHQNEAEVVANLQLLVPPKLLPQTMNLKELQLLWSL
jgi:hypothetical protein